MKGLTCANVSFYSYGGIDKENVLCRRLDNDLSKKTKVRISEFVNSEKGKL